MSIYRVPAVIEIELDGEEMFDEAVKVVDNTLQRAWDTDQGRHHVTKWHFEIDLEGIGVVELELADQNVTDVSAATGGLADQAR
jgi:hypothetical protein